MAQREGPSTRRFKIRHILLGLLLILFAWFAFFRISVHLKVNKRIEALRAEGYPMSLEELDQAYALPVGSDNAADYYMTAFSRYVEWDSDAREGLPWVGTGKLPGRTAPLDPAIRQKAEQFLADNAKTLPLLHEAVDVVPCCYPVDFAHEAIDGTSWLKKARTSAFLLSLEMLVALEHDDPNQALSTIQAELALSRSMNTPLLIHHLVGLAIRGLAYGNIERIVNRTVLTDEQLETLSRWVEQSRGAENAQQAFIGERCFGLDAFRGSAKHLAGSLNSSSKIAALILIPRKILGFHDRDMLGYVNVMQDYIEAAALPPREQLVRSEAIDQLINGPRRLGLLTQMLMPALSRVSVLYVRSVAHRYVVRTALAVERYRQAEGRRPHALADLVPAYLEVVPQDPFDGQDLRYRLLEKGYVVYSIGDDRHDDEGADKDDRKRDADGKVVWDVNFTVER